MALRADFGVDEKAVEEAEAARQRVVVWGDGQVGEIDEAGVAIAFLHVAENLIVGAVLFNDVDDMMKRRIGLWTSPLLPVIRGGDALGEGGKPARSDRRRR